MGFFMGFGQSQDVASGTTSPTSTNQLWLDTNTTPAKLKYYNTTTSVWEEVGASSTGTVTDASLVTFVPSDHISSTNLQDALTEMIIEKNREIIESTTAPTTPSMNDLWMDTSGTYDVLKRWDGISWKEISASVMDGGSF